MNQRRMDPQLLTLQEILRVLQELLESNKRLEESILNLGSEFKASKKDLTDKMDFLPSLDIKAFSELDKDQQQIIMALNQLNGKATIKQLEMFTRKEEKSLNSILKELVFKKTIISRKGEENLGEEINEDYFLFDPKKR
ncbi:MAG: hypothetical protein ACW981_19835 [Candidatus Hodarchaeales archaeon]|jgi:hypothetical protein